MHDKKSTKKVWVRIGPPRVLVPAQVLKVRMGKPRTLPMPIVKENPRTGVWEVVGFETDPPESKR
ncbi:MAG: hypothetical protein EOR00_27940 [Mesorhizobium sp.]|uniref:hypothetical protein n=1 Tax=Mesorhizobium sp. TaxID=1871066 RepID=UPI000FE8C9F4|nr:hypothetical protein [Mesorhizobium sp.]RWP11817.1 MAG: hypothetical protein EOR00_27940 [Mesorhizobium sp.]